MRLLFEYTVIADVMVQLICDPLRICYNPLALPVFEKSPSCNILTIDYFVSIWEN